MGEQPERIGVAVKMDEVVPFCRTEQAFVGAAAILAEICGDGFLTRMAERRIAQVVGKAGGTHYAAAFQDIGGQGVAVQLQQTAGYVITYRASHTGNLQGVGETVVNENAAGEGKYLRLVLQAAKRGGENKAVVVAPEFGTVATTLEMNAFLS